MEAALYSLEGDAAARSREVEALYPPLVSKHYASLIDWSAPGRDPIWLQCMPDPRELESCGLSEDGLGEDSQSPAPRLVRRYPDRAVLLLTDRCFVRCRFCFRKRLWKRGGSQSEISDEELSDICGRLKAQSEVKDILLSGGDPLTLDDGRLGEIIERVLSAGSVETLRVCTRAPAAEPSRITESLARMLSSFPGLWAITHFNHPKELSPEAREACAKLVSSGVPVLNQTVLLAGVNDDYETLSSLFRGLARMRVKPHYLFHADPVAGTAHFATGAKKGLELMRMFRAGLSSLATPTFALDLPEGGGKVPLQPDYFDGAAYEALDGRRIRHPLA